jgi:hypothetical protein
MIDRLTQKGKRKLEKVQVFSLDRKMHRGKGKLGQV